MTETPIETVAVSDQLQAVQAMVLAFSRDPVMRWMYPAPHQYLTAFPEFVNAFGGRSFEHDTAYHASAFSGVALWLPPGVHPDEEALDEVLERTVSRKAQDHVRALLEQSERYHPSEDHWYLPLLGVDPARQRRGYGSALLKRSLAVCDQDGKHAYLESSNPENISLYRRHGFEVMGEIQAGDSPPIYPMLRSPN